MPQRKTLGRCHGITRSRHKRHFGSKHTTHRKPQRRGEKIAGIEVGERIPDKILQEADEVVNIDLTADELITRLKAGNIYPKEKVPVALTHFFKTENILQLRELALKEVAFTVGQKVENEIFTGNTQAHRKKYLHA